ncbi:AAA family ATPase [Thiorhodovibrio frisius]|uniref:ATP-dependent Zn protease n=1 Tax=Thiorhodovibrio frisius TaxID=631362 RepID=H8YWR0_9GAMM|nr:AAA family ATPase [Thiorhodovibrio frisius]EIC22886.1 ATP-dependent Zn protease [Thiorhodovibrio frisius]WPL22856.1 ATP-dependent zinc metalloprotease FtsH [Thiorhodovibrio frisius]
MATTATKLDDLSANLIAWAKAHATDRRESVLDLPHLMLGALKADAGRELISELLASDYPLDPSRFAPDLRERLARVSQPITDQQLPLSPRLKALVGDLMARYRELSAKPLLERLIEELDDDPDWKHWLFDPTRQQRMASGGRWDALKAASERVSAFRSALAGRVLGQEQAVEAVCEALFASLLVPPRGEDDSNGPRMVLTFAGPPGVGKTFLAETLAAQLGQAPPQAPTQTEPKAESPASPLLRLDMSAYANHQSHEQLIGFNPVYHGAQGGLLTGFVKDHPEGVILIDEVEKAHPNTQNLFLQILDAGHLYENHRKETIDFSRAVLIFTTNLGRELYERPNRAGILGDSLALSDTILDALGREVAADQRAGDHKGLSPELLSRLGKGTAVLFRHLDGLALERIARATVQEVSARLEAASGMRLRIADPLVLTLFVLRYGVGGDARRLTSGLRGFLTGAIRDLLANLVTDSLPPAATFVALRPPDPVAIPPQIRAILAAPVKLLLIEDDPWQIPIDDAWRITKARDHAEAEQALRQANADLVLLDLHLGSGADGGDVSQSMRLLQWLRAHHPEVPVYLVTEQLDRRGLGSELVERISVEGGARGVLSKGASAADAHAGQPVSARDLVATRLSEIGDEIRRHKLFRHYQRRLQVLHFDLAPPDLTVTDGTIALRLGGVREVTAVAAMDRDRLGWVERPGARFADIAGAAQAKQRLRDVVGWLRDPTPLKAFGIRPPRGILLTGPPGTGKTSLARALAGEADVPFLSIAGTEILSKWVGESERQLRELFERARRYAPALLFIDEIDSIGASRAGASQRAAHAGPINELLTQLDGFDDTDRPIFVLAATNRPDVLDPALTRPGRFDLEIEVPNPDAEARAHLFKLRLPPRATAADIDVQRLVRRSSGMSGADIAQVCREAAMSALRRAAEQIRQTDLEEALSILRMGLASERVVLTETARRAVAVHESGHALMQHLCFPEESVVVLTILPRGRALGHMEQAPDEAAHSPNRDSVFKRIQVLLAGRLAEQLVLGDGRISAGCADDLKRATAMAAQAVLHWGMDPDWGLLSIGGLHAALPAAEGASRAEHAAPVRRWLEQAATAARERLIEHRDRLERLAAALEQKEVMYAEDLHPFLTGATQPED